MGTKSNHIKDHFEDSLRIQWNVDRKDIFMLYNICKILSDPHLLLRAILREINVQLDDYLWTWPNRRKYFGRKYSSNIQDIKNRRKRRAIIIWNLIICLDNDRKFRSANYQSVLSSITLFWKFLYVYQFTKMQMLVR
jgi:hypothetical protein